MATLEEVKRLAKKVHPKAWVVENDKYLTKEQREYITVERKRRHDKLVAKKEQIDVASQFAGSLMERYRKLVSAAQFVVDVDGDNPSIPQLNKALVVVAEMRELQEVASELEDTIRSKRGFLHKKYSVWKTSSIFTTHVADGDTLDELIQRLHRILDTR